MADVDLENIKAAKVVDARGSACPGPLLEAKKAIGTVAASTKADIPRWAEKVGHEFLGVLEADGYDRIFVTRKK
jgi:tRNA 2-thiouridine synthesizing protein A